MGTYATADATVPEVHALAVSSALRARGLRFVLVNELMAHPTRTITQLAATLRAQGYTLPGRSSKVISDALRWEVRRGRVERLARGLYRYQSAPRSTARRIRLFAAVCHRWIVATTRHQPPPPKPLPCPRRYHPTDEPTRSSTTTTPAGTGPGGGTLEALRRARHAPTPTHSTDPGGTMPARDRLAIALDTADLGEALAIARDVQPHIAVAKVGLQLFSAAGHEAVAQVRHLGMDVFLDVKLHDIPNTVRGAAEALGALGARFLTVHAGGGEAMIRAGIEGLTAGAGAAGLPTPTVLAVTVLTSDTDAPPSLLLQRLDAALAAGCPGVVCAAPDLAVIRARAPRIVTMVPGIRPAGADTHDQARVATPATAIEAGADILVIGRAVTHAADRAAAAAAIEAEVAGVL